MVGSGTIFWDARFVYSKFYISFFILDIRGQLWSVIFSDENYFKRIDPFGWRSVFIEFEIQKATRLLMLCGFWRLRRFRRF